VAADWRIVTIERELLVRSVIGVFFLAMVNLSLSEKKRICHRLGDSAMDAMRFSILAVSSVLLSGQVAPPLYVKIPLPAKNCTSGRFCESQIKIGNTAFVDGQGQTATQLSSFALDIIQFHAPDGPLVTNWIVYFNQYNHTEDGANYWPVDDVYIRFIDGSGNYLSDLGTIHLDRGVCRTVRHTPQAGSLGDIFGKGAATVEITQQTLTNPIEHCGD
jgi:hypothetical protein